jgi:hypothetical protein
MTTQLDLFKMAAAHAQAERETHGLPTLYAFDSDDLADYDRVFHQWQQDWSRFNSIDQSHAWRFAINDSFGRPVPMSGCQPVIMHASTGCHHHHWTQRCLCVGTYNSPHRARCRGCTWRSELVATETAAVLAGLDHAHPGWRQSRTVRSRPYEGTKKQQRWDDEVVGLYGDRPGGWPIITARPGEGDRAVPGRSPWGGYDIDARTLTPPA